MTNLRLRGIVQSVLVLVLFAWLPRVATAADQVPNDRRLPPQVLAYVSVQNVPDLKARWRKTSLGKLGQEKELAEFWSEVDKQLEQLSEKVEKAVGVELNDLLALPQGEVAVAVVQLPGEKLSLAVFLDAGENDQTVSKLLAKAVEAADEHGVKKSTEEFEGTELTIHTHQKGDDEKDKDSEPQRIAYFRKGSTLVGGSDVNTLKSILTRWDGKHEETFAESGVYRQLVAACRDDQNDERPAITWFIDPIGLVKGVVSSMPSAATPQVALALGVLPTLGFDKFKAVGGTVDLAAGDFDTLTRTMVYLDSPPTGVLNLFQFPSISQSPPKWISAEASAYFSVNWDLARAVNTVESLVDMFRGPGTFKKMLDQFSEQEEFGKLHIRKDLLDHLSGRAHIVTDMTDARDAESQRLLIALEAKNAAALKTTLSTLSKLDGFPGKVRTFQGETLLEFGSLLGGDAEGDANAKMGLCVARDQLMFASNITLLEHVLRSGDDQDSLANLPAYQRLAKKFPAETSMIGFQRDDTQIQALYEMLRSGDAASLLPHSDDITIDFSKLPEFDVIRKYLAPSASYMRPDKLGLLIVGFTLKSESDDN